jgi:hypothetical protein
VASLKEAVWEMFIAQCSMAEAIAESNRLLDTVKELCTPPLRYGVRYKLVPDKPEDPSYYVLFPRS